MNKINIVWTTYGKEGLVEGTDERVHLIKGHLNHFITDYGRVLSSLTQGSHIPDYNNITEMKQQWKGKDGNKYWYISIINNRKQKNYFVHKLVAEVFVSNPHNLPFVDHLNYPSNYYKDLEWVTQQENVHRGKTTKNHLLITPDGNKIIIRNLLKFCRQNNLSVGSFNQYRYYRGWIYLGDPMNPMPMPYIPKKKQYVLIDPNGNKIVTDNLTKTCKENGIDNSALRKYGKAKGWTFLGDSNNHSLPSKSRLQNKKSSKDTRPHLLIDPQGNEHIVDNLSQICRIHSLHTGRLYTKGKAKGWLYKGRVDQQEPVVDATLDRFLV